MRTYVERAEDSIKELYEVKGKNTFEKNYGVRRIVAKYLSLHPRRRVKVEEGAARTAIITSDYVIKIDTGCPGTSASVRAITSQPHLAPARRSPDGQAAAPPGAAAGLPAPAGYAVSSSAAFADAEQSIPPAPHQSQWLP